MQRSNRSKPIIEGIEGFRISSQAAGRNAKITTPLMRPKNCSRNHRSIFNACARPKVRNRAAPKIRKIRIVSSVSRPQIQITNWPNKKDATQRTIRDLHFCGILMYRLRIVFITYSTCLNLLQGTPHICPLLFSFLPWFILFINDEVFFTADASCYLSESRYIFETTKEGKRHRIDNEATCPTE